MSIANLVNPFEKYSEHKLLFWGSIGVILGIYVSYYHHMLFRGSLQIVNDTPKIWYICTYNILITLVVHVGLLYSAAKIRFNKTRFIDVLSVVIFSHLPTYISGGLSVLPIFDDALKALGLAVLDYGFDIQNFPTSLLVTISIFAVICIILLILFLYWLVVGFRVVTNSKSKFDGPLIIILVLLLNIILQIVNPYL